MHKRHLRFLIAIAVLAVTALGAATAIAALIDRPVMPFAIAPGGQVQPDVDWPWAVYKDGRYDKLEDGEPHVRLVNMQTGLDFPITPANVGLWEQSNPAISGNRVVFSDQSNLDATDCDIHLYDISTSEESTVCSAPDGQGNPDIDGDIVVWVDRRDEATNSSDIYMKNLSTGVESPVCTQTVWAYEPAVSDGTIVWRDGRTGGYGAIMCYDIDTATESMIATGGYTSNGEDAWYDYYSDPSIKDGIVAFLHQRWGTYEGFSVNWAQIQYYDLATGQMADANELSVRRSLHPVVGDGWITWHQDNASTGTDEIWGLDLASKETTLIVAATSEPAVYGGRTTTANGWVLWHDHRLGDGDDSSSDLYGKFIGNDVLAPTAADDHAAVYEGWDASATVTISANDPGEIVSGVDYVTYQVDASAVTTVAGNVATPTVTGFGNHVIKYSATDRMGNTSPQYTASFTIKAPTALERTGTKTAAASAATQFSAASWKTSSVAILARDDSYYDAFCAAGLAGSYKAPLLLTNQNYLSSATRTELKRLKTTKVFVIGGPLAVEAPVVSSLKSMGISVERLGGSNRYDTSVVVGKRIKKHEGSGFTDKVIVANGASWKSGMSASSLAYQLEAPVILVRRDAYVPAAKKFMSDNRFRNLIVVGPSAAVYSSTASSLAKASHGTWKRYGGASRYDTAAAVTRLSLSYSPSRARVIGLVSGSAWQYAATAGVSVAHMGGTMAITDPYKLSSQTRDVLEDHAGDVDVIELMGNGTTPTNAVGNAALAAVAP